MHTVPPFLGFAYQIRKSQFLSGGIYRMSELVIVNPLCKEERKVEKEDEPEKGMSLCCFLYFCCCLPLILGSRR